MAETAAERAHASIRAGILNGRYQPGTMLSENQLSTALGVSRTPVRAALLRMQEEGLITVYPKRGALVREIGTAEALEVVDARHALETAAARRLTPDELPGLVARLADLVTRQRAAAGDVQSFVELDVSFHRAIVEAGGNSILLDFYDRLRDRQSVMVSRGLSGTQHRSEQIVREHASLVEALGAAEWQRFEHELREHVLRTHGAMFDGGSAR